MKKRLVVSVLLVSIVLSACGGGANPPLPPEPVPVAPAAQEVPLAPTAGTADATTDPVAIPAPEPDKTIQVIVIDSPANDPMWQDIESSVTGEAVLAGMGDGIALTLMAALTKAGCTTGRWVTNHLVADQGWRIGRMGGVEALDNVVQGLKAGTIQLVGIGLAGNYNRVGIWFRNLGQDIMIVITRGEGWSTMFPLGVSELYQLGRPILDGLNVFRNIVGYNAAKGAIEGYIMINNQDAAIWKSVVGELTIGAMALTTGVGITTEFLKLFGSCMEKELKQKHKGYRDYKEKGSSNPSATVNIQVTAEETQKLVLVVGTVVGIVIVAKVVVCLATGQCWVILIPTPAG